VAVLATVGCNFRLLLLWFAVLWRALQPVDLMDDQASVQTAAARVSREFFTDDKSHGVWAFGPSVGGQKRGQGDGSDPYAPLFSSTWITVLDILLTKAIHEWLPLAGASVLPLVFITAWEGMVDRMAVRAGQTVLVLGGAGGVGRLAIQIARARGAKVSRRARRPAARQSTVSAPSSSTGRRW
jgi:hypothetical protein